MLFRNVVRRILKLRNCEWVRRAILKPQSRRIDVSELHKIRLSEDLKAFKSGICRSGLVGLAAVAEID